MLAYLGLGGADDVRAYDPSRTPGSRCRPVARSRPRAPGHDRLEPGRPAAVPVRRAPHRRPAGTNELWVFSPEAGAWTRLVGTGAVPIGRADHAAVWDRAGQQLLVFGGGCRNACGNYTDEVWSYSFPARAWTELEPQVPARRPAPSTPLSGTRPPAPPASSAAASPSAPTPSSSTTSGPTAPPTSLRRPTSRRSRRTPGRSCAARLAPTR